MYVQLFMNASMLINSLNWNDIIGCVLNVLTICQLLTHGK